MNFDIPQEDGTRDDAHEAEAWRYNCFTNWIRPSSLLIFTFDEMIGTSVHSLLRDKRKVSLLCLLGISFTAVISTDYWVFKWSNLKTSTLYTWLHKSLHILLSFEAIENASFIYCKCLRLRSHKLQFKLY